MSFDHRRPQTTAPCTVRQMSMGQGHPHTCMDAQKGHAAGIYRTQDQEKHRSRAPLAAVPCLIRIAIRSVRPRSLLTFIAWLAQATTGTREDIARSPNAESQATNGTAAPKLAPDALRHILCNLSQPAYTTRSIVHLPTAQHPMPTSLTRCFLQAPSPRPPYIHTYVQSSSGTSQARRLWTLERPPFSATRTATGDASSARRSSRCPTGTSCAPRTPFGTRSGSKLLAPRSSHSCPVSSVPSASGPESDSYARGRRCSPRTSIHSLFASAHGFPPIASSLSDRPHTTCRTPESIPDRATRSRTRRTISRARAAGQHFNCGFGILAFPLEVGACPTPLPPGSGILNQGYSSTAPPRSRLRRSHDQGG